MTSSVRLCNHLQSKAIVALWKPWSVAFDLAMVAYHKFSACISFIFGTQWYVQFHRYKDLVMKQRFIAVSTKENIYVCQWGNVWAQYLRNLVASRINTTKTAFVKMIKFLRKFFKLRIWFSTSTVSSANSRIYHYTQI